MQQLFDLFNEIGLPYFLQGSLSDEEYPASFFTYWNIDTPNDSFYDNAESRYITYMQIGWYTNDARKLYLQLDEDGEFYKKAKQKGFVFVGRAKGANADKKTYNGRVLYLKIIHKTED
jgi:hypothetical protein